MTDEIHEGELSQAQGLAVNFPMAVQGSGGLVVNGKTYLWDYVNKVVVPEKEMKKDKERMKASARARWAK